MELTDCRIANAVRCVPPENKPTTVEIATCRDYLKATIAEMSNLRAIVALGRIAHDSVVTAFGAKKSATPFKHGGKNMLGPLALFSSYHCSRYNTNTGVLTPEMFRDISQACADIRGRIDAVSCVRRWRPTRRCRPDGRKSPRWRDFRRIAPWR